MGIAASTNTGKPEKVVKRQIDKFGIEENKLTLKKRKCKVGL